MNRYFFVNHLFVYFRNNGRMEGRNLTSTLGGTDRNSFEEFERKRYFSPNTMTGGILKDLVNSSLSTEYESDESTSRGKTGVIYPRLSFVEPPLLRPFT